jgi:hypothetical protein
MAAFLLYKIGTQKDIKLMVFLMDFRYIDVSAFNIWAIKIDNTGS